MEKIVENLGAFITENWLLSIGFTKSEKVLILDDADDLRRVFYERNGVVLWTMKDWRTSGIITPHYTCKCCGHTNTLHLPEEVLALLKY